MAASSIGVDFAKLDRDIRAATLVGFYFQYWALMETAIDNAISKVLNLSGMQQFVLGANLPFHNKAYVLGCLISLSSSLSDKEKSK